MTRLEAIKRRAVGYDGDRVLLTEGDFLWLLDQADGHGVSPRLPGMTRRAALRLSAVKTTDAFAHWLLKRRRFALANLVHTIARQMTHRRGKRPRTCR